MNKTNFKLFTMFLAGIAFSAMTVLAATISISTNFEDGVTQYLKKLVILKNDNTTGMVLDGDTLSGENIYGTNIYGTNITGTNIKGTNITGNKIYGQSGLFSQYCDDDGDNCSSIEDLKLWSKNNEDIYYTSGNVGIGDTNPTEKLVVEGSIKTSKVKNNNNSYIELFQNKLDFVSNELVFKSPNGTQEEKVTIKGGKVGIGTNNSSEKLEVNGTGKFSGNISAKNGYFSGMEIKGGNVKSLSTVEHKLFTGVWIDDENGGYRKPRFFPKGVLTGEENEALETDSKRYIFCQDLFTGGFLLFGHKSVESQSGSLGYVVMPFTNNVQYDLKAGETFYLVHFCPNGNIKVNKQEYGGNTTSRE